MAVVATASASRPTRAPKARTIATVPGRLEAFAATGHRLAWLRGNWACPKVEVFDERTLRRVRISPGRGGCGGDDTLYPVLAFDGERALWQASYGSNFGDHVAVFSAALHDRRTRVVGGGDLAMETPYDAPFPMAATQGRLVFYEHDDCEDDPCWTDGVRFVVGHRTRQLVAGTIDPVGLALARKRLVMLADVCDCDFGSPVWSPNGTMLAWTHRDVDKGYGVDVALADGSGRHRLAEHGGDPSWAPDGSRIAFTGGSAAGPTIETVRADGSDRHTLARGLYPRWSPAGGQIAFVRGNDLYRVNADGSAETRLTTDGVPNTWTPQWSPDAKKILVERFARAYVVDAVTGSETVLPAPYARAPVWSPDGTKIAFAAGDGALAVMDGDGSNVRVLDVGDPDLVEDDYPAWSPDGGKIAFQRTDTETYDGVINVINADGTGRRTVGVGVVPRWAPDGSRLAWDDVAGCGLVTANADGSQSQVIAANLRYSQVTSHSLRSGRLVGRFDVPVTSAVSVAASRRYVGIVDQTGRRRYELRRYRAGGEFLGSGAIAASSVIAGPGMFVYARGRSVVAVDAETGRTRVVAKLRRPPRWLTAVDRRLFWAEDLGRATRIRELVLPR